MNLEIEIYQILKNHKLTLKKREEVIIDLLELIKKDRAEQLILSGVVHTLKDCFLDKKQVKYNNKKYYLTQLEVMNNGEEICELMDIETYEYISDVNGKEVKIF